MLVVIKDQCRFPLQGFDQFQECFDLAVMDLMYLSVIVVQCPICKLQKFVAECRSTGHADLFLVFRDLKHHFPLQFLVRFQGFRVKYHRNLVIGDVRKLQVILCLHADADIRYPVQDRLIRPRLSFVAVYHAVSSALVRLEVSLPELGISLSQTLAAIQQKDLRP